MSASARAGTVLPGASRRGSAAHRMLAMHRVTLAAAWVLVALQLQGGPAGELAAAASLPIIGLVTYLADRRYLATLLVFCIPAVGVLTVPGAGPFVFPDVERMRLVGIELPPTLVVLLAAGARVGVEVLRGGRAFRGIVPSPLLTMYLVAFVPAAIGALHAQSMGMNQWSIGFRAMLALGGLLWGVLVGRSVAWRPGLLADRLVTIVVVGSALLVVRFVSDMYVFLLMGMAGGLLPHLLARRRLPEAGVLAATVLVGVLSITLTTLAQVVLAMGCVALATFGTPTLRRFVVRSAVVSACLASAALIWVVVQLHGRTLVEVAQRDDGIFAFAMVKLLGDRGPLWLAAIQQIVGGPHFIVPAGRPLRPDGFGYGELVYLWDFGSHNTFLELLRHLGLFAGGVGIVMMLWMILSVSRVLTATRNGAVRGLAAGFVGTVVIGMTTGNFPMQDVGFFLWALAGMILAMHRYATLPPPISPPVATSPLPEGALPAAVGGHR